MVPLDASDWMNNIDIKFSAI